MGIEYIYFEYFPNSKQLATVCPVFLDNKVGSAHCARCPLNEETNYNENYVRCRGSK
jgi:hypothetical protein